MPVPNGTVPSGGMAMIGRLFAAALVAGLSAGSPGEASAEPPSPRETREPVVDVVERSAPRPDHCPYVDEVRSLAEDAGDTTAHRDVNGTATVRVAERAAERLRTSGWWLGPGEAHDSQCRCIAQLSVALTSIAREDADDVRSVFAKMFPDCRTTDTPAPPGDPSTLQAAPDAGRNEGKRAFRIITNDSLKPLCPADCNAIEPPPAHDASRTIL
jgi:hypothetical protein